MKKTNHDARTKILTDIRSALRTARIPNTDVHPCSAEASFFKNAADLPEKFVQELEQLNVTVFRESSIGSLQERVRSLTANKSVLCWNFENLPYNLQNFFENRPVLFGKDTLEQQAMAEVGVTGVDAAIAETGSIILFSWKGKPRTASLLPFEHVAICKPENIFYKLSDFFKHNKKRLPEFSNVSIISGPSRTADIEMQLTLGVHGPGKMTVVIGPPS